jgi:hypothetical protein
VSAGMLNSARTIVQERRHRQSFGGTATAAAKVYLERSRATDDAVERLYATWLRRDRTLAEHDAAEQAAGDAWEALYLAALDLDTACPAERAAAELVKVMAGLHMDPEVVANRRRVPLT